MKLPEIKQKKLINVKEFAQIARKVKQSFEKEAKYLNAKRVKDANNIYTGTYSVS